MVIPRALFVASNENIPTVTRSGPLLSLKRITKYYFTNNPKEILDIAVISHRYRIRIDDIYVINNKHMMKI